MQHFSFQTQKKQISRAGSWALMLCLLLCGCAAQTPAASAPSLPAQSPDAPSLPEPPATPEQTAIQTPAQTAVPEAPVAAAAPQNAEMQETLRRLRELTPDVDYAEHEVMGSASSQAEAEAVAAQYGMTLVQYASGVARYQSEKTVIELLELGLRDALPPVYPNYIRSMAAF